MFEQIVQAVAWLNVLRPFQPKWRACCLLSPGVQQKSAACMPSRVSGCCPAGDTECEKMLRAAVQRLTREQLGDAIAAMCTALQEQACTSLLR